MEKIPLFKQKKEFKEMKKYIINSATYEEMVELIEIMRKRKQQLDLKKEAEKRTNMYEKIKDK